MNPEAVKINKKVAKDAKNLEEAQQKSPEAANKEFDIGFKDVEKENKLITMPKYKKITQAYVTQGKEMKKEGNGKIDMEKLNPMLEMVDKEVKAANKRPGPN